MERKQVAVRVTDLERVLDRYESPVLGSHFRVTLPTGRITRLLIALQGQDIVPMAALEATAHKELGVSSLELSRTYLPLFQEWGFVRVYEDKIEENIADRNKVLDRAGRWWEQSNPHPVEKLSLHLFNDTATAPRPRDSVQQSLDRYPQEAAKSALTHLSETNLVDRLSINGSEWFYSPEVFSENYDATVRFLASQKDATRRKIYSILDSVIADQGIPHTHLSDIEGGDIVNRLTGAGLLMGYPMSVGDTKETFYFTPDLRNRFELEGRGDKFELIKTGISHFQFAHRLADASTGRLKYNPSVLLDKLIEQGRAGNATAIGTDYYLLVQRGLVKVERISGSRCQFLLPDSKEKVADLEAIRDAFKAKQVIPSMDILAMGLPPGVTPEDSIVYRSRRAVEGKELARQFAQGVFEL